MQNSEEKKNRPQDKWDEKAGLVPKTYKVDKEVAEEFKEVCKEVGVAMGESPSSKTNITQSLICVKVCCGNWVYSL